MAMRKGAGGSEKMGEGLPFFRLTGPAFFNVFLHGRGVLNIKLLIRHRGGLTEEGRRA
jgi:hypothetical protein